MHEVELANSILNALRRIASERKSRVVEVDLKIGEINHPESLRLWLKKLGGDYFRHTKFKITKIPINIKCVICGYSGAAKIMDTHIRNLRLGAECPKCCEHEFSITTGQELEIVRIKLGKEAGKRPKKKSR